MGTVLLLGIVASLSDSVLAGPLLFVAIVFAPAALLMVLWVLMRLSSAPGRRPERGRLSSLDRSLQPQRLEEIDADIGVFDNFVSEVDSDDAHDTGGSGGAGIGILKNRNTAPVNSPVSSARTVSCVDIGSPYRRP